MSEDLNNITQKIEKVTLRMDPGDSKIKTIECRDKNDRLLCELTHEPINKTNEKYLPILRIFDHEDNIKNTIEITNLKSSEELKNIIDKILECRIYKKGSIVDDGLTEAESMCFLMQSGDDNRDIGYIVGTSDNLNGGIVENLVKKRLKIDDKDYAVGIVTANCHAGSIVLLSIGNNSEIYEFDTESSHARTQKQGPHREEDRDNIEYAAPIGEVFGYNKVKSLNFFCKEALQRGNTCELWSSIICLEARKCRSFKDFISTISVNDGERKILKGSFIERCSKIVSAITDKGKKYNEIDDNFLGNYHIPNDSNSVELKTLRILCQMDGYELKQDRKKSHSQPLKRPRIKEMEDISYYWRNKINKKDRQLGSSEMEL